MTKIPKYVARQYEGGARGFRDEKRRQLRAFAKAYIDLRMGCAFFPRPDLMDDIEVALTQLEHDLSTKTWGR